MTIDQRIRSLTLREREELAGKVGTTGAYLSRIAYANGELPPGPKLARKLAKELGMPLSEVRPDIWGDDAA